MRFFIFLIYPKVLIIFINSLMMLYPASLTTLSPEHIYYARNCFFIFFKEDIYLTILFSLRILRFCRYFKQLLTILSQAPSCNFFTTPIQIQNEYATLEFYKICPYCTHFLPVPVPVLVCIKSALSGTVLSLTGSVLFLFISSFFIRLFL